MEGTTEHSDSPHSRITRYYLSCLAADSDNGLSLVRRDDSPDYTVPNATTLAEVLSEGFSSPSASRSDQHQRFVGYLTFIGPPAVGTGGARVEPILLFEVSDDGSVDPLPFINPAFIKRYAMGADGDQIRDTLDLQAEIGLADPTPPLIADVIRHLHEARPGWPWQEPPETDALGIGPFGRAAFGIYNRAIICSVGQSQFTRGLANELDALARKSSTEVADTALGAWINGAAHCTDPETNPPDLLEPLPLNREQREAVQRALTERLTVITGPPGTGKSQVVTALLINAVVHGQRVLFASKNNKAVDVVEERLNGFGSRPVLLRLGSDDHRQRLAEHLDALRGGRATADDLGTYQQQTEHHVRLLELLSEHSRRLERTVALRNQTDRLEREGDEARNMMTAEEFAGVRGVAAEEMDALRAAGAAVQAALPRGDRAAAGFMMRLFWFLIGPSRVKAIGVAIEELRRALRAHSLAELLPPLGSQDFPTLAAYARSALERLNAIARAHDYFSALTELQKAPSPERIAKETLELRQRITANSIDLWQSWVRTQPSRLTEHDRRALGDFSAVLRLIVGANQAGQPLRADVFSRYYRLFDQVGGFLPAWAVTALSARWRLPLVPGAFDLLVIDEASQCDIASALPLLYRCKRAVIIGDPKQLRHISAMPEALDLQKLQTYSLADGYQSWSYTAHSLYQLASSLTHTEGVVQLRDHHRSHPDIIGFSNRHFYESTLRVATKLNGLSPVWKDPPFVRWLDIAGRASRPSGGSLFNEAEARAVVGELLKLMQSGYSGSVGVVTPFREQANRIRRLLASDNALQGWASAHGCIMETAHRYQGDERDAIIFSPVISRGTPASSLRFLGPNGNLFNVAITRARATLIVVGDKTAAKNSGVRYLADFADYVDRANDSHAEAADLPAQALSMTSPCAGYPPVRNPHQVSEWECILYRALYASGLEPLPQYTVDRYDLDLALFAEGRGGEERRLDIEVDGQRYHQDWDGELIRSDQLRNERLIELGWDVMRFWVYEVRDSLDDCVARVKAWTEGAMPGR